MAVIFRLLFSDQFVLRTLLVVWFLSFVIECSDLTKRDTIHRIVLKSSGKGKHRGKSHRSKGHRLNYRDNDQDSDESSSTEKYRGSRDFSNESVESKSEEEYHKERRHPKRHKKSQRHQDFDIEETKNRETYQNKDEFDLSAEFRRPKSKKKSKKHKTPYIEFTTGYPVKDVPLLNYYEPFPPVEPLPLNNNYNYNQYEPVQSQQQQFPVLAPSPVDNFYNYLPPHPHPAPFPLDKSPSNTYEVHEPAPQRHVIKNVPFKEPLSLLKPHKEVFVQKTPTFSPASFHKEIYITTTFPQIVKNNNKRINKNSPLKVNSKLRPAVKLANNPTG